MRTTPNKNITSKEPLPRVKGNSIQITPSRELNKIVIYETPREKRKRIRNKNKHTTWVLSPNQSPSHTTVNAPSHTQPITAPLQHLIDLDDLIFNNKQHKDQLNAI